MLYEIINNKYFKDGKEISKEVVKLELKAYQLRKLKLNNKCNVRKITPKAGQISTKEESLNKLCSSKKELKNKEILTSIKNNYKTETNTYRKLGVKHELWRRNIKGGYYNFVCYLDSLEENIIDEAILKDYKKQKNF